MANKDNVYDIGIGTSIDQKGLKKGLKDAEKAIKDFVKGAGEEIAGIGQLLSISAGGGPVALGKAFVQMGQQAVAALNNMAASYRQQEQAEAALQNAARNNPYLNDRVVRQLKAFAGEMQRTTGIDSDLIMQSETRLAGLGRNQEQIQKIINTAADMSAAGIMDYEQAIDELNHSYNGMIETSRKLYPELKGLSDEALASGGAIDIIAGKVAGSAAEAMKTGAGSVQAYENAVGDLKKIIGEDWENATKGFRVAITRYIEKVAEARKKTKEWKETLDEFEKGDVTATIAVNTEKLKDLYEELAITQAKLIEDAVVLYGIDAEYLNQRVTELSEEIKKEENRLRLLRERQSVEEAIENISTRTATAAEQAGTAEAANLEQAALRELVAAKRLMDMESLGDARFDAARAALNRAEAIAKEAEAEAAREVQRITDEEKIAQFRVEYQKALVEQARQTLKQAELAGEISKEEYTRLAAIKDIDELANAEISSINLRQQLLGGLTSAYTNLLNVSEGLLNGELEYEQAIEQTIQAARERLEVEKLTDKQREQSLNELASRQKDLENTLQKIYEDAQGDARRQEELANERKYQETVAKLRGESVVRAAAFERRTVRDTAIQTADEKKKELEANKIEQEKILDELLQVELEKYREGHPIRSAIEEEFQKKKEGLAEQTTEAIVQIEENLSNEIQNINAKTYDYLEEREDSLLEKRLNNIQQFIDISRQIAGDISTLWGNIIDYQTDEKLRANDEMIQSDEERAAEEEKIMKEAAFARYKAELFAWSANVTMATATAALAALRAFNEGIQGTGIAGGAAAAAIASAMGAMQIAAVASAMPKAPRFHSGGVVQGGGEIPAVLMGGEKVTTNKQFSNIMDAFANMASMRGGGGGMNVKVINNAAKDVSATPQYDAEGLTITVEKIVANALGSGRLDPSLAMQQANSRGTEISY